MTALPGIDVPPTTGRSGGPPYAATHAATAIAAVAVLAILWWVAT